MTPYQLLKLVILRGNYDKKDVEKKISVYLQLNKLSYEEYEDLQKLLALGE